MSKPQRLEEQIEPLSSVLEKVVGTEQSTSSSPVPSVLVHT